MLPNPDILNQYSYGKFVLSNLAAKRAKQLGEGAPALVHIDSKHPLTIALAEIAAGKIKPVVSAPADLLELEDMGALVDETMAERGMLLPGLDEIESALIAEDELIEDESDLDAEVVSLSDLVGEDEEAEVGDETDGELSLNDLAEQESSDDESEPE
jgi:DNA-directed RNA polymerase subunit omega